MKKRILLSLVSFFAMTAMWASILDAYKITVSGENAKTNSTAVLTLSMDNKQLISIWQCTLVLPEGVTFESVEAVAARYPEAYGTPEIKAVPSEDGRTIALSCEGEDGVTLTGTAGAIATVTVKIGDIEPGEYAVTVKNATLYEVDRSSKHDKETFEYTWTIEQGETGIEGDLTGDGVVNIADAVSVLELMASGEYSKEADLTGDGVVNIADFVSILEIMAQ